MIFLFRVVRRLIRKTRAHFWRIFLASFWFRCTLGLWLFECALKCENKTIIPLPKRSHDDIRCKIINVILGDIFSKLLRKNAKRLKLKRRMTSCAITENSFSISFDEFFCRFKKELKHEPFCRVFHSLFSYSLLSHLSSNLCANLCVKFGPVFLLLV